METKKKKKKLQLELCLKLWLVLLTMERLFHVDLCFKEKRDGTVICNGLSLVCVPNDSCALEGNVSSVNLMKIMFKNDTTLTRCHWAKCFIWIIFLMPTRTFWSRFYFYDEETGFRKVKAHSDIAWAITGIQAVILPPMYYIKWQIIGVSVVNESSNCAEHSNEHTGRGRNAASMLIYQHLTVSCGSFLQDLPVVEPPATLNLGLWYICSTQNPSLTIG